MRYNLTLFDENSFAFFYHSNHVKMKHKQHLSIKEVITCKSCPEDSKPFLSFHVGYYEHTYKAEITCNMGHQQVHAM
jgi:hypothetical protein